MMQKKQLILMLLWCSFTLSSFAQNLLINGDFQRAEAATSGPMRLLDWTSTPSDNTMACGVESKNGFGNSYNLKLGAAAGNIYGFWSIQQTIHIEAGKNYFFEGYVQYGNKTDLTNGFIYLKNPLTNEVIDQFEVPFVFETLAPVRAEHKVSYLFQIPDNYTGTEAIFEFNSNNANRIIRADNFSLVLAPEKEIKTAIHIDVENGNDENDGLTPETPIRSLAGINQNTIGEGTKILFKAGTTLTGSFHLSNVSGTAEHPIQISSYWDGLSRSVPPATIDGAGQLSAIRIEDCNHVAISKLRLTANGGGWFSQVEKDELMRVGLLVRTTKERTMENIQISELIIADIFYEEPGFIRDPEDSDTANGTQGYGYGIRLISKSVSSPIRNVSIKDCDITRMSHTGVKFTGSNLNISDIEITGNKVYNVGGPGMQFSQTKDCYFARNTIDYSGSFEDSRSWKRGSGMWMYGSQDFLIEHNRFTNANGPKDSAGAHIDCNNKNIVLQYNYSANNAGAFVEILGNSWNCCYRYNISVNDGWRVDKKPVGGGLIGSGNGRTLWLSGYTGGKEIGPFYSYIYNNTIYVDETVTANYFLQNTATGILIANNIFNVIGGSTSDSPNPLKENTEDVFFKNNLFLRQANWPAAEKIKDTAPLYGSPEFKVPGGTEIEHYTPMVQTLVKGKGIQIPQLSGDEVGVKIGLKVEQDILGQAIGTVIDMGAIALSDLTSISNTTKSNIRVYIENDMLQVVAPGTYALSIYTIDGTLQQQVSFTDQYQHKIGKGAFLIKVGTDIFKIVSTN